MFSLVVAPACMHIPQNRQQFVAAVREGSSFTEVEDKTIERGFDSVVAMLTQKSDECLAKDVDRTGYAGSQLEVASGKYLPVIEQKGQNSVEFTLRVQHSPRPIGAPEGGVYVIAIDLSREGASRTKATLYTATMGYDDIVAALRAWLAGENAECPELD
jgi:hypothetical protein